MITEFQLENFKPFAVEQKAACAPITLIYGPNSGGKSSIIQALMLIRQSVQQSQASVLSLIPRGEYVDLGSFRSLLHRHDLSRTLKLSIQFSSSSPMSRMYTPQIGPRIPPDLLRSIRLEFVAATSPGTRRRDSSQLARFGYQLDGGDVLKVDFLRSREQRQPLPFMAFGDSTIYEWADEASVESYVRFILAMDQRSMQSRQSRPVLTGESAAGVVGPSISESERLAMVKQFLTMRIGGSGPIPWRLIPALRPSDGENDLPDRRFPRMRIGSGLESFNREFTRLVEALQYLGPLRSYPARHYLISGGSKSSVGTRGEDTPHVIYRSPVAVTRDTNEWLKRFEIPYRLTIKPLGDEVTGEIVAMHLKDTRSKVELAPSDVGFGIGQLLPIVVQGLVSQGRILCVEQPEIHLHPRLQAHLADYFIATSVSEVQKKHLAARRAPNQWIIETHSEALLLRLQRRIREGRIPSEHVSVLYVRTLDDGASQIVRLRLDDAGQFIDTWPEGFFEEAYNELLA